MSETNGQRLPPGWAMASIEDLFWPLEDGRTLHQGWSPLCEKTPAPTDADWGVLKTTAIQAGAFLPQHNKTLPKHLTPRPQTEVKSGDILITCAGPRVRCGVACLVRHTRPRLMMSGKMYRFRVSPDHFDARFLEAYLLTSRAAAAVDKMKTGGSDSGLNLTHDRFRPLPVPVAPLKEQRRIMDSIDELFSDLDAGIATLERVQTKLKIYRASVLKAAVDGALTTNWRRKHPATEPASVLLTRILAERRRRWEKAQLQKFKDADKEPPKDWKSKYKEPVAPDASKLKILPHGWCWTVAEAIGDIQLGRQRSPKNISNKYPTKYLRAANITEQGIDISDVLDMEFTPKELSRYQLKVGDILLSEASGSPKQVGKPAICREEHTSYCFQNTVIRHQPVILLSEFLLTIYKSFYATGVFSKMSAGVGINHLSADKFSKLMIPLAPITEQEVIVEAVEDQLSVIEHLEADLEAKLKSAQALRQSILRHAFTGQLVPQNPKDEPAAELLKRIAAQRAELARQKQSGKPTKRLSKKVII
jgi:type I restriction enzyme S subunit